MDIILEYFPDLTPNQQAQLSKLQALYSEWNKKINVISRKDMDNFYERHVLHSLSIGKYIEFLPQTRVLDVGTGGGFPAVPLAILFPEVQFWAVDSIGKKIKVVDEVCKATGITNIKTIQARVETLTQTFDFVITRAVAPITDLYKWTKGKFNKTSQHAIHNGIIALKGGNLKEEFADFKHHHRFTPLSEWFSEEFFETKKIVYVPMS